MTGPKSFRELLKPKPQSKLINKQLVSQPPPTIPKAIRDQQIANQKLLKGYVNTQRCPLCSAQLDGPVYYDRAELYCVEFPDEYSACFYKSEDPPVRYRQRLKYEIYGYELNSKLTDDIYHHSIYLLDLNLDPVWQQRSKTKIVEFDADYIDLDKSWDEKSLLKKIDLFKIFV